MEQGIKLHRLNAREYRHGHVGQTNEAEKSALYEPTKNAHTKIHTLRRQWLTPTQERLDINTCWCVVINTKVEMRGASVVGGRPVVPDHQYFVVAFKAPHGTHVPFPAVLLAPLPVGASDNPRTDALHLQLLLL